MADKRYRVGIGGLTTAEVGEQMRAAIADVERRFPNATIAIFAFDKPPGQGMGYIASGQREDIAKAVAEWAARMLPKNN